MLDVGRRCARRGHAQRTRVWAWSGELRLATGIRSCRRQCRLCCQVLLEPAADLPTKTVNVTCWEWAGTARDEGDFAAEWLSEVLGKRVRLVRYMGEDLVANAPA